MDSTFTQGFLAGFLAASLLGFLSGRMYLAIKRVGSPGRLQSVSSATNKSPLHVLGDAFKAFFAMLIYGGLLLFTVYVLVMVFRGG